MIKIKITYLITVAASILLLFIGHKIAINGMIQFQNAPNEVVTARVQNILEQATPNYDFLDDFDYSEIFFPMMQGDRILFQAKVTQGIRKGEIITAEQIFSPLIREKGREVRKGDSVLLFNNEIGWYFSGYVRTTRLIGLGIFFIICILFFGGKKGFNTILSLALTCAAIFAVFIPSILSGKNIYLMSLFVCAYTIAVTLLLVIGFNKKSLAAVAGCAGGIIIAGLLTVIMDRALYLTGIIDEHSRYLVNLPGDIQLNLRAIVFAGIIIGAMGAIMDVAISIASSLWELKEKAEKINFASLFRSGLTIGRDIMGSTANTLILAYIGSSLTVVLLLSIYSGSFLDLFNSEMVAVEILQALVGTLGLLFAMPLTALFCSIIYLKDKNTN